MKRGLSRRGRVWHFVKRVPREYERLDPRRPVRISLETESETIARAKALAVEEELFAYWAALAAGRRPAARAHYDAAVKLAQARDVLLVMVETGLRPSEIVNLRAEDLVLEDSVPHLRVAADGSREFKSANARRDIPLVGVSLEAARGHPGGFPRYRDTSTGWSVLVNRYLRDAGLLETPAHKVYSLRHSYQDRLTAAEVPERIQADLMGHGIDRPRYGAGASLEQKRKWIEAIAVSL